MSTIKVTNVSHPSAASPAIVLDADGDATYAGVHDFSAATVTGAPQGLVLVTPTSIANSGGSASLSGRQITLTGVTTISVNGCFTSAYDNYVAQLTYTSSNVSHFMLMRLRASGSDATTNYKHQRLYAAGGSSGGNQNLSATSFECNYGDNTINAVTLGFYTPNLAAATPLETRQTGYSASQLNLYGGQNNNATAYDGFTLYLNSGSITGLLRIYGYQKS